MFSYILPSALLSGAVADSMDTVTPLSEKMLLGLQTLVLGLGTVMLVLAFLWGVLELFRVIFYDIPNKRKAQDSAPADAETVEPNAEQAAAEPESDDNEVVAVITAAVAAYLDAEAASDDKPAPSFRVVSFKKIHGDNKR